MSETHENNFKFALLQDNEVVVERIMNANLLNPSIRYSVDIRDQIREITKKLENVLSRRNLTYRDFNYDFLKDYQDNVNFYSVDDNKLAKTKVVNSDYSNKSGVEFVFGLYINDNTIVERKIFVENYNPASRFSKELNSVISDICYDIFESLRLSDMDYMWDDYIISEKYGLNSYQSKDLSISKRKEMVEKSDDRNYVKRVKSFYRTKLADITEQ